MKIDPYGECLQCGKSLDGGDMLEQMSKLEIYFGRTEAYIKRKASEYFGYNEERKRRFTHLISNKLPHSSQVLFTCPFCKATFEEAKDETIKVYKNLYDARSKTAIPLRVITEESERP